MQLLTCKTRWITFSIILCWQWFIIVLVKMNHYMIYSQDNLTSQFCYPGRCCPSLINRCNRPEKDDLWRDDLKTAHTSCSALRFPAGGLKSDKSWGMESICREALNRYSMHFHSSSWARPVTTGPDLHTGSWQASCDVHDVVLTGALLLSSVNMGNDGL